MFNNIKNIEIVRSWKCQWSWRPKHIQLEGYEHEFLYFTNEKNHQVHFTW